MVVRLVMKGLVIITCLGYLMMWIMMPTTIYSNKWSPSIQSKIKSSTFFGTQGKNLLLYVFPIAFIAFSGSIYLHLMKQTTSPSTQRSEEKKTDKGNLGILKRPVLSRGPLGIVTGTELGFLLLLVALIVWSFVNLLKDGFSSLTPDILAEFGVSMWQAKLETTGRILGQVGNMCLVLLFFPVTRASSILPIFGLTSEMSIKYHIWLGHMAMALFTSHGLCYVALWGSMQTLHEMLEWAKNGISNVAGELSLLSGLAMWVMSLPRIRRKAFEAFFYTHYLYIPFVLFYIFHIGISFAIFVLPGFVLFVIDRYLRFLQSRQHVCLLSARILSSGAFELNFSKSQSLSYNPTSIIFINVPSISKLQWHPFTITSSSGLEPEELSVVIKVEGSWTRRFNEMLTSSALDCIEVSIDGPYGPASTDFLRHEKLVMISGGSGITPFYSIIRELMHLSKARNCKIPTLHLVCAFKNLSDLGLLDLLLPVSGTHSDLSGVDIQIEAYITRHKEPTRLEDERLETRIQWFKPNEKDTPICPILGQNGWLWLGMVIASSFIGCLVFIGLLTRYYIHPIQQNPDKTISSFTRATLSLLIMCVCIAVCGGLAVLFNKQKFAMETNLPIISPQPWLCVADRELGIVPHQPLAQSTSIHYGERPNLKKLLSDYTGTSVGVLVSGPTSLRHDVATICRSSLANNLHFESISFTW